MIIQPSSYSTIVSTTAPARQRRVESHREEAGPSPAPRCTWSRARTSCPASPRLRHSPESIANFNQWDGIEHAIHPGDQINIPPGARVPDPTRTRTRSDSDRGEDTEAIRGRRRPGDPDLEEPRCADGARQGTYTIEAGDIPADVAESLDVTVDQLDEANANTPGYRAFIVGADILVPCGDELTSDGLIRTWSPDRSAMRLNAV